MIEKLTAAINQTNYVEIDSILKTGNIKQAESLFLSLIHEFNYGSVKKFPYVREDDLKKVIVIFLSNGIDFTAAIDIILDKHATFVDLFLLESVLRCDKELIDKMVERSKSLLPNRHWINLQLSLSEKKLPDYLNMHHVQRSFAGNQISGIKGLIRKLLPGGKSTAFEIFLTSLQYKDITPNDTLQSLIAKLQNDLKDFYPNDVKITFEEFIDDNNKANALMIMSLKPEIINTIAMIANHSDISKNHQKNCWTLIHEHSIPQQTSANLVMTYYAKRMDTLIADHQTQIKELREKLDDIKGENDQLHSMLLSIQQKLNSPSPIPVDNNNSNGSYNGPALFGFTHK